MKPLVCIGFAEALSAPEVAWSLLDSGYQVLAFARKGSRAALRHSRYVKTVEVTAPERDCAAALQDLQSLLASAGSSAEKRAILPLDDGALWLCSQMALLANWTLAGPRGAAAELALNKYLQTEKARSAGLAVPETLLATSREDALSWRQRLPLVLKPAYAAFPQDGKLGKGRHWICADERELEQAVSEWNAAYPLLVQRFISGIGEGVFGLAREHGVTAWSAHRRIRMMNPHGSGSSACASRPVSPAVKPPIQEFVRDAQWQGLFMMEFLRDADGAVWFVEFNGRSWGSMALSRRRGFEYPAWSVNLALDSQAVPAVPVETVAQTVCRNAGREFMHLLFVLRGPQSKVHRDWPSFWRALRDVLWLRREDFFYNWRSDDRRVFWRDWWYTVSSQLFKSRS